MGEDSKKRIDARIAGAVAQHVNREVLSRIQYQIPTENIPATHAAEPAALAYASPPAGTEATEALQLEWERKEAMDELEPEIRRLQPPSPDIEQALGALRTAPTVAQIRALRVEIRQEVQRTAEFQDNDKNINNAQLADDAKDAELNKLWTNIGKLQKEVRATMDKACDAGYISKEENQKSKDEHTALDKRMAEIEAMPEGEEKQQAIKAFVGRFFTHSKHDKARINKAITLAEKDGNNAIADELREALPKIAKEEQECLKFNPHSKLQLEGTSATSIPEITPSEAFASSQHAQFTSNEKKMGVVHDVTHNDIEVPGGGKDRTGSRTISKK